MRDRTPNDSETFFWVFLAGATTAFSALILSSSASALLSPLISFTPLFGQFDAKGFGKDGLGQTVDLHQGAAAFEKS
jgi:hypothetical protein